MPVSLRNADILFNDGSTQATAGVNPVSSFGGGDTVGSVMHLYSSSTSGGFPGNTTAGSTLFRQTAGSFLTGLADTAGLDGDQRNRTTTLTNATLYTFTPCAGTWRLLSVRQPSRVYGGAYGTESRWFGVIAIRIA